MTMGLFSAASSDISSWLRAVPGPSVPLPFIMVLYLLLHLFRESFSLMLQNIPRFPCHILSALSCAVFGITSRRIGVRLLRLLSLFFRADIGILHPVANMCRPVQRPDILICISGFDIFHLRTSNKKEQPPVSDCSCSTNI